ncbi:MAG: hypothetical protein V2I27_10075 [Erythrobacter sp.]|jgi:alkanesulfonate monooxygenase SsuD/methylene tetrahydromethanopterin reductase-like flavin-dependent oxidoreductase (luciferase family)|nr:hypothetical protein [Erythrobacter sp.]
MPKTNEILEHAKVQSQLAPENHNSEQIDHPSQAQQVAAQAKEHREKVNRAVESRKPASGDANLIAGSETDLIDHMREMEDTGAIDRGAFEGEPDHDDREPSADS